MKILQVGPYPPPMGGWSFHIKQFQDYLQDRGVENQVLNVGASRRENIEGCIPVLSFVDYVKKHLLFLTRGYTVYNHVDGCSWKGFVLTFISQFLSLVFFRRPLLSFHAGIDQYCFDKKRPLFRIFGFFTFFFAGKIICNSDIVKQAICSFNKREADVQAIPCFSSQYLDYEKRLTREQGSFIKKHGLVLFTYLFFREGFMIEELLDALAVVVKQYPSLGVIIVGDTAGCETYIEKADAAGLTNHLFLAGDVDHDNFLSLLSQSSLYVRTHLNDGVCSSVLEALALGVPVVASYNLMRPDKVITFERNDGADLLTKLSWSIDNRDMLHEEICSAGVTGRDTLKEEYELLLSATA